MKLRTEMLFVEHHAVDEKKLIFYTYLVSVLDSKQKTFHTKQIHASGVIWSDPARITEFRLGEAWFFELGLLAQSLVSSLS